MVVDLNADIPYKNPKIVKHTENQNHTYSKALEYINSKWSEFFSHEKNNHTGYFDLISQSIYGMQAKLTQIAIEKHNPEFVVQISRKACDTFEFHRSEEMIAYGREQCKKASLRYNN